MVSVASSLLLWLAKPGGPHGRFALVAPGVAFGGEPVGGQAHQCGLAERGSDLLAYLGETGLEGVEVGVDLGEPISRDVSVRGDDVAPRGSGAEVVG